VIYKVGYGKKTVENNIRVLMKQDSLDYATARKSALMVARSVFRKKHPGRDYPAYLEE